MSTDFAALDALYPLPAGELSRQWIVSLDRHPGPEGWGRFELGPLHLAAHPHARVCALSACDGTPIGWVIEALAHLSEQGDSIPGERLTLPLLARFTPAQAEAALYGRGQDGHTDGSGFAGPWTAILRSADGAVERLYLGVTHSVVICPERRLVAASPAVLPSLTRDLDLSQAIDPLATNDYYQFGLTPFVGVERLLPNHALDLDSFRIMRHWPPHHGLGPPVGPQEGVARVVAHARRLLAVLGTAHEVFRVPLSAGRDSRAILACLRPYAAEPGRIELFTTSRLGLDGRTDTQVARKLAAEAGLALEVNKIPTPAEGDAAERAIRRMRTFARIGEAQAGRIVASSGAQSGREGRPDAISLPGMAAETARAFYWSGPYPPAPLAPEGLMNQMRARASPAVRAAAAAWLKDLPSAVQHDARETLDFAYVEQRMGCWDAPSRYVFPGRYRANLSLMGTTLAIETMLRLPPESRRAGTFQADMVVQGWPDLLAFPFNEPVGWLRALGLGLRARRRLRQGARRLLGS